MGLRDYVAQQQFGTADSAMGQRRRFGRKPLPTGSKIPVKTIGIVRVARFSGSNAIEPPQKITSGCMQISSIAYCRVRSVSPLPQRTSITTEPSPQPRWRKPSTNAARRRCASGSFSSSVCSTAIRRMRLLCSARAIRGQAVVAEPTTALTKSRRRIFAPTSGPRRLRCNYSRDS